MNYEQKIEFFKDNLHNRGQNLSGKGALDTLIYGAESKDLTGAEVMKICQGQVKIVPYHELVNYSSLEQLLEPHGATILLYETKKDFGHYTALFYDRNNNIEFFDSYGFKPDQELKFAKYDKDANLTRLIKKYDKPVIYNNTQLQEWEADMNTCGRWCSMRIRFRDKSPDEFVKLFKNNQFYNGDWFVSALTFLYTY